MQVNLGEACERAHVDLIYILGGTVLVGQGMTKTHGAPTFLHPVGQ